MADLAANAEQLCKRYQRLHTRQAPWRNEWRLIAEYIVPRKLPSVAERSQGSPISTRLYSSIAVKACEDLAAAIHGTLTNSSIRWFRLVFPLDDLNRNPEAASWLETVSDRMFLAFQQSNFDSEFSELYLDLGGFGTGVVFLDEPPPDLQEFGGLRFRAFNIAECVIAEDPWGRVDTVMRKLSIPVGAANRRWPEKLSDHAKKKLEVNPDEPIEILHAVVAREEFDLSPTAPPPKRPFSDTYIEIQTKHLIADGGFFEFPFAVPRWSKNSGEEYGRGPGSVALPDVRTLNAAREMKLKQWAKVLTPPLGALDNSVIGSLRLIPGAINYFTEKDPVWPIESGTRFDVTAINEQELVQSIREIFFSDLISLPPLQGTPMSATEAAQRFELMERKLGPTIGRLKAELLQVIIKRAFGIMSRAGAFPLPPDAVVGAFQEIGFDKGFVDIRYEGPLERAQRASDLATVERTLALAAPALQLDANARVVFKTPELVRYIADKAGLPANLLSSEEEIAAAIQQLTEQQAEKQGVEIAKVGAEALKAGSSGIASLTNANAALANGELL